MGSDQQARLVLNKGVSDRKWHMITVTVNSKQVAVLVDECHDRVKSSCSASATVSGFLFYFKMFSSCLKYSDLHIIFLTILLFSLILPIPTLMSHNTHFHPPHYHLSHMFHFHFHFQERTTL